MDATVLLDILVALGLLSGIGLGVKAWYERRQLAATAASADATATAVVTAAARELVDPLRRELAQERADHAGELDEERSKVAALRRELQEAWEEARALRAELASLRRDSDSLRTENARFRAELHQLRK